MVRALCWVGGGKWAGRVAHDSRSLLGGVGGSGVVRALCWVGGKWAGRVAHETCSLLGGGEGGGTLCCAGWAGGSGPHVLHMTRAVCWVGGRGRAQAVSPDHLNHQVHYHACEPKKH